MSIQTASYIEAIAHLPKGAIVRIPHVSWEDYDQLLALEHIRARGGRPGALSAHTLIADKCGDTPQATRWHAS